MYCASSHLWNPTTQARPVNSGDRAEAEGPMTQAPNGLAGLAAAAAEPEGR